MNISEYKMVIFKLLSWSKMESSLWLLVEHPFRAKTYTKTGNVYLVWMSHLAHVELRLGEVACCWQKSLSLSVEEGVSSSTLS